MRLAFAVVASLALAAPALANESAPQPTDVSATASVDSTKKDADERKICKRIKTTESRLGAKKLCMTKEQWREYSEE